MHAFSMVAFLEVEKGTRNPVGGLIKGGVAKGCHANLIIGVQ